MAETAFGSRCAEMCLAYMALSSAEHRRRFVDRGANPLIGRAAADIAVHGIVDVAVRRFRSLRQKADRRHDLTGLAIAALHDIEITPCGAHRLGHFALHALDRRDRAPRGIADLRLTGALRLAVDMHGAGAALGDAAAEFRTGHIERIAERPEERHLRIDVEIALRAIDGEADHVLLLPNRQGVWF